MDRPTPMAWSSLVHDRRRLLGSVAGVAFAIVLMLTELGFFYAIEDGSTRLVDALAADLLLVNPLKDDLNPSQPFPRERLAQARAVPGVVAVAPLWTSRLVIWSSRGRTERDVVRLLAIDPADAVFRSAEIRAQQRLLERPDTALVDRKLRDSYGGLYRGVQGELDGRRIQVVGDFEMGPDLQVNATLLVSDQTFRRTLLGPGYTRALPPRASDPLDLVELGIVRLEPGAGVGDVASRLEAMLPRDVVVRTPNAVSRTVHEFWTRNQPVGAVFGLGFFVGFLIGLAICYQVLYTDIVDQLPQFATLKAIGYRDGFLVGLAIRRGALLAAFSLVVALPASLMVFAILEGLTKLPFTLTPARASAAGLAAMVMCILASVLATRQAVAADPADVF